MNIYDIAKEANVSISTVSRVMNNSGAVSEKTRKKVEKVIENLDYSPNNIARSLASKKSSLIGLLVPDIRNYFHSQSSYEIDNILKKYGYTSMLTNTGTDLQEKIKSLKLLKQQQVEGIITVGSIYNEDDFIKEAIELNKQIPIVQLNNYNEHFVSVYCDEKSGMLQSMECFRNFGYKKPIFVSVTTCENNRAYMEKRRGYKYGLNKFFPSNKFIEFSLKEKDLNDLLNLIKNKEVDSIQCENDSIAIKIYKFLTDNNVKVPEDAAIIGFDNEIATNFTQKRISSIDHSIYEHSKVAVEQLLKLINHEKAKMDNVIKPQLIIKETT